jgi:hypothetical protein
MTSGFLARPRFATRPAARAVRLRGRVLEATSRARPVARLLGPALLVAAGVAAVGAATSGGHVDLEVYRRAGERWLLGQDPYASRPELPFTYPPFAAALASLVAAAPLPMLFVLGVTTVGAAAWGAAAAARSGDEGPSDRAGQSGAVRTSDGATRPGALGRSARPGLLPFAAALAVASEPVLRSLHLGQVNGVVVGLVLVDLLVLPPGRRGWLTGLAAGLKLTPLVFALHLAARRDRAALGRLFAAFGLTAALGVLALPAESLRYWGALVGDARRVGDPAFADNQSLLGAASRLVPDHATTAWLVGSAVTLALALVALRRTRNRVTGVVVCTLAGLLVSPISWSHHWLLLPAAGLVCWRAGHRGVALGVLGVALGFGWLVGVGPPGVAPNAMTLAGVAALVALALPAKPAAPAYASEATAPATTSASSGRVGPSSNGGRQPVA